MAIEEEMTGPGAKSARQRLKDTLIFGGSIGAFVAGALGGTMYLADGKEAIHRYDRLHGPQVRTAAGVVSRLDERVHQGRKTFSIYTVAVDFVPAGAPQRLTLELYQCPLRQGDRVTVVYDAENPALAAIQDHAMLAREASATEDKRQLLLVLAGLTAAALGVMGVAIVAL